MLIKVGWQRTRQAMMTVRQFCRKRMLAKRNLLLSFLLKGLGRCEHILSHRNTSVKATSFNNNYIHMCICIQMHMYTVEPYERSKKKN